jgi:hypothetical protein
MHHHERAQLGVYGLLPVEVLFSHDMHEQTGTRPTSASFCLPVASGIRNDAIYTCPIRGDLVVLCLSSLLQLHSPRATERQTIMAVPRSLSFLRLGSGGQALEV